jgi:hypothetical protein
MRPASKLRVGLAPLVAACAGHDPPVPPAPLSCGAAVVLLAQPSADLCAPYVMRPTNADKRNCVVDVDDPGDDHDGDIDTCVTPHAVYDQVDLSGMTTASGVAERFWVMDDSSAKSRRRCNGPCIEENVDVPDPASGNDCNGSGRVLRNSKWIFLVGRGPDGVMTDLGQMLVVGHFAGDSDLKMLDPESISRFEKDGRQYLVIIDAGLKNASKNECKRRGACFGLRLGSRCTVDPAAAPGCADQDNEVDCLAGGDCAWLQEPPDPTLSREGQRYGLAMVPEPDPDEVAGRGPDAYDTICIQSDNGRAPTGTWAFITLPKSGCDGATGPCPPEAALLPDSVGLFNIEGAAVVPVQDGLTLLLFTKAPSWRAPPGQCAGGIYKDAMRVDGVSYVLALDHIEKLESGHAYGLEVGQELALRLIARVDLGARAGDVPSDLLRVGAAEYAADPSRARAGWLLMSSNAMLLGRAWDAASDVLDAAFFDGLSQLTNAPMPVDGQDCTACVPEQESLAARIMAGGLRTYHAGESSRVRDASGRQHPAPVVAIDHCELPR